MIRGCKAPAQHCFSGWGIAKLVKAPDFDSGIPRFESLFPSHPFRLPAGVAA
jgi:hypothetical protein